MDYETKIYLDKLVEAVDKLDSPDWWIIVLTIINIGAFVFVAWTQIKIQKHQTKLQEQQTKAQEYEIHKRLYTLINKINLQIDNFIVTVFTFYIPERNSQDNPFIEYIDKASDLLDDFTKNTADFELKFPNEKVILKNYQFMLMEMLVIFKMFHFMSSIEKQQGQTVTMDEKTSLDCLIGDDAKRVEVLLSLIPHEGRKFQMAYKLESYLKNKATILEQNFIGIIANRCKMD